MQRPTTVYQYLKHANALMTAASKATAINEKARLEHGYRVQLALAKAKMESAGAKVEDRQLAEWARTAGNINTKGKK